MGIYADISPEFLGGALLAFILEPQEDRDLQDFSFLDWFPINPNPVAGYEFEAYSKVTTRNHTEAMPPKALDSPVRTKGRDALQKKRFAMMPFGEGYPVMETDTLYRAAQARDDAQRAGFLEEIFDDLANAARALRARWEIAACEILRMGTLTIDVNGVKAEASNFGRDASNTSTAATQWSVSASATPTANERVAIEQLRSKGIPWTELVVLTERSTWDEYLATDEVKSMYPSFRVLSSVPPGEVNSVREQHGLPPVVVVDNQAREFGGTASTQMQAGDWVYVPRRPVGQTVLGTPPVASNPDLLQASGGGLGPGPVAYIESSTNPSLVQTNVEVIGNPVGFEPDATYRLAV